VYGGAPKPHAIDSNRRKVGAHAITPSRRVMCACRGRGRSANSPPTSAEPERLEHSTSPERMVRISSC
jgi:hypothetical protein